MGLLSSQISTKRLVPLCRQLSTSYNAGIPIIQAFATLAAHSHDRQVRQVFQGVAEAIKNGDTLAAAAKKQSKYLPPFLIELLASGETGGRLDEMLADLADYYEDKQKMQRVVRGALAYPMLQLAAAWFLGTFALKLVGQMDPLSGKGFDLTAYFHDYLLFQAQSLLVFGVGVLALILLSRTELLKWVGGFLKTYLWPISIVARKFALARFFRSMAMLIGSGVSLKKCIASAAATTGNPYIERDLLQAIPYVADGHTLVEAFSVARFLTPVSRDMLFVGEQSGELEQSLKKVANYHLQEAQHAVQIALKVMGVLIVLVVSGLIGYIIISFYSNLYGKMFEGLGI